MPITINGTGTVTGLAAGGISNAGAVASAAMPTGSILQVVTAENQTEADSTSDIDLLTCSITPSAASSNVYVQLIWWIGGASNPNGGFKLTRAGTAVGATSSNHSSATGSFHSSDDYPMTQHEMLPFSWNYLDTGISTTSATEYKLSTISFTQIYYNRNSAGTASGRSTIILMEVAA